MLDGVWDTPVNDQGDRLGPLVREDLETRLANHPVLARIVEGGGPPPLSSVEESVRESLLARPKTIHSQLSSPEAVRLLEQSIQQVQDRAAEAFSDRHEPRDTPLDPRQHQISTAMSDAVGSTRAPDQAGFDRDRVADPSDRNDPYINGYLDELYASARESQEQLASILAAIERDTGGEPHMRPGEKDRVRALDKIIGDYGGRADRLSDLLGGKVQYGSVDELYNALEWVRQIAQGGGAEIVSFKDRLMFPVGSGYRDVQMFIRMPNGHIGELRMHLTSIDEAASYEHALYEVQRDLPQVAQEQGRQGARPQELTPEEAALIEAIRRRTQEIFWAALQESLPEQERDHR
jgi:hypothetical protein